MKLTLLTVLIASVAASIEPVRMSYHDLLKSTNDDDDDETDALFADTLQSIGMLSITGLPASAREAAVTMRRHQHACLMEISGDTETFADGTVRRTLATYTVAGALQPLTATETSTSEACEGFEQASNIFRKTVQEVVTAFANKLTAVIPITETPLLTAKDSSFTFDTVADIVEYGQHLEHFHSYQKLENSHDESTIDLHTDQGLFLAFTPGRWSQQDDKLTTGFYIAMPDDTVQQVDFDESDNLVFLLGDGVNQYVNSKTDKKLRAVPHSLQLQSHAATDARVWYGRMVLPPAQAVHPIHQTTFAQLRQGLLNGNKEAIHLACSNHQDHMTARLLDGTDDHTAMTCENDDELYCWHRCMNITETQVSGEAFTCQETFRELQCVNPRGQVWGGEKHGDYYPDCAAADAPLETEFDELPGYPRADATCTSTFDAFVNKETYENSMDLANSNGENVAVFQWTVIDDSKLKARLAFDGIFGYLAVGLANVPGGDHNGMNGANIVMAKAATDYTARDGLDFSTQPDTNEYIIHPEYTAFRHWMTPYKATTRSADKNTRDLEATYSHDTDGCYTAVTFEADQIASQPLNVQGTDEMLWAANDVDSFMQYHGGNRGRFAVTWSGSSSASTSGCMAAKPFLVALGASAFFIFSIVML